MNELDDELYSVLSAADVVLAKGDLNYRRFFEDRAWIPETPVAEASVAVGMVCYALRVLKSDVVVGIDREKVGILSANDRQWRSNGCHALIQRVDIGD
jgi:hypothetical protein